MREGGSVQPKPLLLPTLLVLFWELAVKPLVKTLTSLLLPRSPPLWLTFLPCFACFQARTSISPTGPLLCPRLGWVRGVLWLHSPALLYARRFGAVPLLRSRYPAILGRAPLPLRSLPRLTACRVGVASVGGFGAQHGLLRSTLLLPSTG